MKQCKRHVYMHIYIYKYKSQAKNRRTSLRESLEQLIVHILSGRFLSRGRRAFAILRFFSSIVIVRLQLVTPFGLHSHEDLQRRVVLGVDAIEVELRHERRLTQRIERAEPLVGILLE